MNMNTRYVKQFILILLIEILLPFYGRSNIFKLYTGYILMVPLIYSFIKIFIKNKKIEIILITFIFLLFIEFQRYTYIDLKLLSEYRSLKSFSRENYDLIEVISYALGSLYCYGIEVKDLGYKIYFLVSVAASLGSTYYLYQNLQDVKPYDYYFYFFIFVRVLAYFNILNILYMFIGIILGVCKLDSRNERGKSYRNF